MAYVRWSDDSALYIYAHYQGFVACCGCLLIDDEESDFRTTSLVEMLAHVQAHRNAGHRVPDWLDDTLRQRWDDPSYDQTYGK